MIVALTASFLALLQIQSGDMEAPERVAPAEEDCRVPPEPGLRQCDREDGSCHVPCDLEDFEPPSEDFDPPDAGEPPERVSPSDDTGLSE